MQYHRKLLRPLAVTLMVLMAAFCAQAEKCNHFFPIPTGGASCFTYVFEGNQTCNINAGSTSTDSLVNPWVYNGGTSCVTVTYNPNNNTTTVTICGAPPIEPGQTFHYPKGGTGGNGEPHIGLDGGNNGTMTMVAGYWSNPPNACSGSGGGSPPSPGVTLNSKESLSPMFSQSSAKSTAPGKALQPIPVCATVDTTTTTTPPAGSTPMPMLSLTTTQTAGTNPVYYTLFVSATDTKGNEVGGWFQQPYTAGTTPAFQIVNNTTGSITVGSVGFITNDSSRPLDTLNFGETSPPGVEGSPFATPSVSLQGTVIPPGGSITAPIQ